MARLLLLTCLAAIISVSLAATRCGNGHSCVTSSAACVSGECVCQAPYVWGDGRFNCYKGNTVAAEAKNDPVLTNFNNETLKFPFPCRFLVTHVTQELKDKQRNVIGNCEFKIHSFNAKAKGKFFTLGFDIAARINYDSGTTVSMSGRNYGTAENGVYTFTQMGSMGSWSPDGPWGSDNLEYNDNANGIKISQYEDTDNNQLVFEFKKCGLRISLVPYDLKARRSQVSIPGLSIAINCAMHPQWHSHTEVMGLAPVMGGGSMFGDHVLPGLSEEQSIIVRAFDNEYTQNQPWSDNGQCLDTNAVLDNCNDNERENAFNSCYWMLNTPRFVRCYDKTYSGNQILELFKMCVDMFCGNTACGSVQNAISNKGCASVSRIPMLTGFMNGNYCP